MLLFFQNLQGKTLTFFWPFIIPNRFPGNMTTADILTFEGVCQRPLIPGNILPSCEKLQNL